MEIEGDSLDDVLIQLYERLPKSPLRNTGRRGDTLELLGVSLRIFQPRARLSRSESRGKPFSALGELLWYLAKSDKLEFIQPYVPKYRDEAVDGIIPGAYGPRLFAMREGIDQLQSVVNLLGGKSRGSRRAVVQLFNAEDIASDEEIPCTTTLQFLLRGSQLHLSVTLRSNDAYWGLPHDVFCFTMLQEMMARRLSCEIGEYYQYVGSMHVYEPYLEKVEEYVTEGHQKAVVMPAMPAGNPFLIVEHLLAVEDRIRHGEAVIASEVAPDSYWADIVRLLQVFWAPDNKVSLDKLKAEFADPIYRSYLDGRRKLKPRVPEVRPETHCG